MGSRLAGFCAIAAVAALGIGGLKAQQASEFPNKVMTIIGYSNPGGPLDLLARSLADGLRGQYGKPVIVENRVGAAGITASLYLKKQPPDGHTLFYGTMTTAIFAPQIRAQLPYDTRTDFTPVALTTSYTLILVARPTLPFKTLDEFVDYAKKNPGKLNYATNGIGAWTHIAMELFQERTGAKLTHVPYTGHAPALQALLAGDIEMAMLDINIAKSYIDAGTLRVIGQLGTERTAQFPDVATFGEKVPELATEFWLGIFGPPGMSPGLVSKLNADINTFSQSDVMKERAKLAYMNVRTEPAEAFRKRVENDWNFWGKVVRDKGIIVK